jgi:hypothetical protein
MLQFNSRDEASGDTTGGIVDARVVREAEMPVDRTRKDATLGPELPFYDTLPDCYAAGYYECMSVMWELVQRLIKKGEDPTMAARAYRAAPESGPTFPSLGIERK